MTEPHDTYTTALPTPGAGPAMRMLAVAAIVASTTNPRKTFNPEKLQELANSIAASGVHQPVLLRPLPADRMVDTFADRRKGQPLPTHELVAGERRWRACQLAGVTELPAMIRELTDAQVLEIQIVENLQREDVSELEEAEGYGYLMQQTGLNADLVGAKIGKSRSYVYARLKLLDLCQEGRQALRDGVIDASKALLLARIPDHTLQLKALRHITPDDYGHSMSYRDAASYVQREYMLRLDAARFKITDGALLPTAGACTVCPKRTGHAPELFADVKSADTCTDPKCYREKEDAHDTRQLAQAIERGQEVISGREAKELMPSSYSTHVEGYLRLDDKSDSPGDVPLRKLIGKAMEQAGIQATLVANPHQDGALIAVLLPAQVATLLAQAGHAEAQAKMAQQTASSDKHAAELLAKEKKERYEQGWRDALLQQCLTTLGNDTENMPVENPRLLFVHLAQRDLAALNNDQAKRLAKLFGLGKVAPRDALRDFIDGADHPENLLFAIAALRDSQYSSYFEENYPGVETNKGLITLALDLNIDPDVTKVQTQANMRAQEQAEKLRLAAVSAAQNPVVPLVPAALAGGVREAVAQGGKGQGAKGRGTGKTGPAAHAHAAAPKTSKAQASAAIAAALSATGDHDQAPSAQGNEAPTFAHAQAVPADVGQGSAGAETGAASTHEALAIGAQVRVLATATGKKQAPHVGKLGSVQRQVGPEAWDVALPNTKRGVPMFVAFHTSELECVA